MKRPRRGSPRKQPILDALMIWTAVQWYRRQENGGHRRSVREATAWLAKSIDPAGLEPHPGLRPAETLRSLYRVAVRARRTADPELLALIDAEVEWLCAQELAVARYCARERCISQLALYKPPRKRRGVKKRPA